jgi:hypothetical protein
MSWHPSAYSEQDESPQAIVAETSEEVLCYPSAIIEADQFASLKIPGKRIYMHPWLTEQSMWTVTAWRGVGKSGFALAVLDSITKGKPFGPWKSGEPVNCLYLDGEMAYQDVRRRLQDLGTGQGNQSRFYVYSDAYAHTLGLPKANLLDETWQDDIRQWMLEHDVKIWVIDNLASLSGGIDENSRQEWAPIGDYLLKLRFDGITTGIIHHAGKAGDQRGTSAHEDHVDICITLKRPSDYRANQGARFVCSFTKSRIQTEHLPLLADVEFQLKPTTEGRSEWTWKLSGDALKRKILNLLGAGMTQTDVVNLLGVSKGHVSKVRTQAIEKGWLTEKNRITQLGSQFLG